MHLDWNLLASGLLKQAASGWAVVKSLSGNSEKEHGGKTENLRGCYNEVDACLGDFLKVLGVSQLPIGAMRSKGVSEQRLTVTF